MGSETSGGKRGSSGVSRRKFLASAGSLAIAGTAFRGNELLAIEPTRTPVLRDLAAEDPAAAAARRRTQAAAVRHAAEIANRRTPVPPHPSNGDEDLYPNRIGSFSKGLPHDALGEVDPTAYETYRNALLSGDHNALERITMGCPRPSDQRRLVNPMAGVAFDIQGTDSHALAIRPAPALASPEAASEMTELYWMALLRDVPFLDYASHPLAAAAAAELTAMTDFRGPRAGGVVTPATLFRDAVPGCLAGPYLSQFLWLDTPFGAEFVDRRARVPLPNTDHMTTWFEYLDVQSGCTPSTTQAFDPVRRYLRNGRDLGEWVHIDVLYQAYFNAALILLGLGAPLSPENPYNDSLTQEGFGTFGGPHIATIVAEPATRALKAVWFQKWFVHRRLRPEVYAARVHNHLSGAAAYPVHADVLGADATQRIFDQFGSYLLPMVFPEGSPVHPSYGAGHATVAGACVTMLKAMFDETWVLPDPVVPTPDGLALVPYTGPDAGRLTVGGELNKLASNIATGRNLAGVHYRTDGIESLRLGEAVAIGILRDHRGTFGEKFGGFRLTRFDGTPITI